MSTAGLGDLSPRIVTPPPGPESRRLSEGLRQWEAPAVNTLVGDSPPIVWREACGSNVVDVDDNLYVDLTAGFGAAGVGHRHPRVVGAIREASTRLLHGLGDVAAHESRVRLAERLANLAPVDDAQIYWAVAGADAVEIALKSGILSTDRSGILAFRPGYHGVTLGALAVGSRDAFRQPFARLLPEVSHLDHGSPEEVVDLHLEQHPEIGTVILEPVIGREGVRFPADGWTAAVARAARRHGCVVIVDEIFTGLGRTGRLWACDHDGLRPDLLCCGKILGGGMPIGAVVGRRQVMETWQRGGEALHTGTFIAHPLSCAAAEAVLDVLASEALVERARRQGERIAPRLQRLAAYDGVHQVRGRGLLWGVALDSADRSARVVDFARARGVLVLPAGETGSVIEICPPLTISDSLLDEALDRLEESIDACKESS